jgi:single-stranded DNA-binding protein
MSINVAVIEGVVVEDPTLRRLDSGEACRFLVDVDRVNSDRTDRIPVQAFGEVAVDCMNKLTGGSRVLIQGPMRVNATRSGERPARFFYVKAYAATFLDEHDEQAKDQGLDASAGVEKDAADSPARR